MSVSEPKKTARLYVICAFVVQLSGFILIFSQLGGWTCVGLFFLFWGNNMARTWVRKL